MKIDIIHTKQETVVCPPLFTPLFTLSKISGSDPSYIWKELKKPAESVTPDITLGFYELLGKEGVERTYGANDLNDDIQTLEKIF